MILQLNILVFTSVAAWMDLKCWKVKNYWILAGIAGAVWYQVAGTESPGIFSGLLGMIIPLAILLPFYGFGKIGAGDVKVFAVSGLYLGQERILWFLLVSVISGALWAVVLAVRCGSIREVLNERIHVAICAFVSALCLIGGLFG